jgi:uncharacterized integral membrane protein (TIGR00697 family)
METKPPRAIPLSLFVYSIFYGGMVCIAGVLGAKQVSLGATVAKIAAKLGIADLRLPDVPVEAGIFAFLLLVVLASSIAELHGRVTADRLVRFGFIPLLVSMALIQLVLVMPEDPHMFEPAKGAFPIILGQGARMMLAGLIAYGTSQTLNVLIFAKLAGSEGSRLLWLRAMVASVASQIVDTLLFITISFYRERPILDLMLGQMAAKIVLSLVLVPALIYFFVGLGRRLDGETER